MSHNLIRNTISEMKKGVVSPQVAFMMIKTAYLAFETPEAEYYLARFLLEGIGVPRDEKEGMQYLIKSAENGWVKAQAELGRCYFVGEGVGQDYTEAVKWLRQAAEKGDSMAANVLVDCYTHGLGVTPDKKEALKWLGATINEDYDGDEFAFEDEDYDEEIGVKTANLLYKVGDNLYSFNPTSKENQETLSYDSYTFMSISDHGSSELLILKRIFDNVEKYALLTLHNDGGGMGNDYICEDASDENPYVYENLHLSCNMAEEDGEGFVAATREGKWGVIRCVLPQFSGRVEQAVVAPFSSETKEEAIANINGERKPRYDWFVPDTTEFFYVNFSDAEKMALGMMKVIYSEEIKHRAEAGEGVYQAILGLCYLYGSGISRDLQKSYEWATKAVDSGWRNSDEDRFKVLDLLMAEDMPYIDRLIQEGDTFAMTHLAACYHIGTGVDKDNQRAKELLDRAIQLGDPEAESLKRLYFGEE